MEAGWRVFIVWECALRSDPVDALERLAKALFDPVTDGAVIE